MKNQLRKPKMTKRTWFFLLLLLFFVTVLSSLTSRSQGLFYSLIYLLSPAIAFFSCVFAYKAYGSQNPHGRSLFFLSFGLGCWFLGEIIWIILEEILAINPFPSVGDLFFLSSYPFILYGLTNEFRLRQTKCVAQKMFLIVVSSVILSLFVFYFGVYSAYDSKAGALENIFSIGYGLGDLIILIANMFVLSLMLEYQKGKLFYSWSSVFVGFSFTLLADIFFAIFKNQYALAAEEGFFRQINDLLWVGGFLFLSYGFVDIYYSLKETRELVLSKLRGKS